MLINFQQNIRNSRNMTSSSPFTFGTTEKKLLIVFLYYLVAAVINLTTLTLFARNASVVANNLQRYFFCEQGGFNPSNPCSLPNDIYHRPYISSLGHILLSLLPVVNLIYAVNIKELKEVWRKTFSKKLVATTITHSTDNPSIGSNVVLTHGQSYK